MRQELQHFVDMLEGADLDGRALSVALATDLRNKIYPSPPFLEAREKGMSSILLVRLYQQLQKEGDFVTAAGCAICLQTERASSDLTLVVLAKRMWELLAESFPYVEEAAADYEFLGERILDIRDFDQIPEGLS